MSMERAARRAGAWGYIGFMVVVLIVFGLGYWATHADTASQVNEANRKASVRACESLVISRDTLRKVVRLATEPMTDLSAIEIPPDPELGQSFSDGIERVLDRISAAQSNDGRLRDALLEQAPPLRCTREGVPVDARG